MRWSCIRLEPAGPRVGRVQGGDHAYRMQLPLIGDGRLAWSLLRQHPEWAVVERDVPGPDRVGVRGRLLLLDNQWTCVWQDTGGLASH